MTGSWESWSRYEWSKRLVDSHFLRSSGHSSPVEFIDASGDALASCAGAPSAEAPQVREGFLDLIARSGQKGSPWRKLDGQNPTDWYAYLVAACAIFIDSDQVDERACIEPLVHRLGPTFELGLEQMPSLWKRLSLWLDGHSELYRALVLPDPGGWTRIGHTAKLAFPPKRDQLKIAEAMSASGIADDPTLAQALDVMRRMRTRLSGRMQDAIITFESLLARGASASELYDTALWSAVLSASRAVYQREEEAQGSFGVLVFEEEDMAELSLVGRAIPEYRLNGWKPVSGFDPWTHVFGDESGITRLLNGDLSFGRLSRLCADGLVPLVNNGYWELIPRGVDTHPTAAFALSRKIIARLDDTAGVDREARFLALNRSAWFASKSGYTEAALASYQAVIDAEGVSELARWNAVLDQTELLVELGQYSSASQRLGLPDPNAPSSLGPLSHLYTGRSALVAAGLGDAERSSQLFSETQELLCESLVDDSFLVLMYRMHAELHRWQRDYDKALDLLAEAEAVIQRASSSGPTLLDYAGHIARARADVAIATGDLAMAQKLVDEAHRVAINMSYDWLAAEVAVTSGTLHLCAGNLEHAVGSAKRALAIARPSGFLRQELAALLLLLTSSKAEPVAARRSYLLEAQAIQEQSGFVWHQADFEGLLADLDAGGRT